MVLFTALMTTIGHAVLALLLLVVQNREFYDSSAREGGKGARSPNYILSYALKRNPEEVVISILR